MFASRGAWNRTLPMGGRKNRCKSSSTGGGEPSEGGVVTLMINR